MGVKGNKLSKRRKKSGEPVQLTAKSAILLKEGLIREQNGRCAVTGRELKKPRLDHEHRKGFDLSRSGLVRGVIEDDINQLLGKIEFGARNFNIEYSKLPDILRCLAVYLEKPLLQFIHPSEKPKEPVVMARSYTKLGNAILASGGKLPKWWGYRMNKNGKPAQKLTKQLSALYIRHGLKPEFYKNHDSNRNS